MTKQENIQWNRKDPSKSSNRRDFLRLAFNALTLPALSGLIKLVSTTGGDKSILRPPGALAEQRFRALCLPCGRCEEICAQRIIRPVLLEEDLESLGTPRLIFTENYCNLCMECAQACPTGALQPIPQSKVRIGIAKVVLDRCVAWVSGRCDYCIYKCPYQAIRTDNKGRPYVVAELCNGCGICEQACRLTAKMGFTKGIVIFPIDSEEVNHS